MALSALIQFRETRGPDGKRIMQVVIPRRVFTYLRSALPDSISLVFENIKKASSEDTITFSAKEFKRVIEASRKKRKRR